MQSFITTFSNATFVGTSFSTVIPIDLRTKYVVDEQSLENRRRRLLQAASTTSTNSNNYIGYLPYPVSLSVIRPTLQVYYYLPSRSGGAWLLVPTQTLAQDSKSISATVPRSVVVASNYRVSLAAFAVSQPPPPEKKPSNQQQQQQVLNLLLAPQLVLAVSPIVPAPPTPPKTPAPTPAEQPLPPTPPTPPPPPPPEKVTTMDAGVIAGIVIACVVVVAGLGAGLYVLWSGGRGRVQTQTQAAMPPAASSSATNPKNPVQLHSMFRSAGMSVSSFSQKHRYYDHDAGSKQT